MAQVNQDHPLGRPILGRPQIVEKISGEDLRAYINQEYTASRMVFAAAGAVSHSQIVDLCGRYFCKLPCHTPQDFEKATYKGGRFFEKKDLEQVHLLIGFESCPFNHPDYFPFAVFSNLLGGGMSSRLFQEVREKRGLVYSVSSFNSVFRDTGVFGIYAGTSDSKIPELIPVIKDVLSTFTQTLEDKEIERSRAQFKADLLMSLERTSARCEQLAQHMLIYQRPLPYQEIIDKINAVTREDLTKLAESLQVRKPTCASIGPGSGISW